jgi:hypothetical protein
MKRSYFIAAVASATSLSPLRSGAADLTKRKLTETNVKASGWGEPSWYCGSAVVWLNLESGTYYHRGARLYGRSKPGAYICEREAISAGNRAGEED